MSKYEKLPPRYELVDEVHQYVIRDVANHLNIFFLAESGHGIRSSDLAVAEKVVNFLNGE